MTIMTAETTDVIGGVDTHQDLHTAAIVSSDGAVLGTRLCVRAISEVDEILDQALQRLPGTRALERRIGVIVARPLQGRS